jgi:hypothetical protein
VSEASRITVPLHRLAHARAGDKGNRLNIAVFAYRPEAFPLLTEQVTQAAVAQHFAHRQPHRVTRYLLPNLLALNFVIDGVLEGGVNSSLTIDRHGKALSYLLLELPVAVPHELAHTIAQPPGRQT